MAVWESELNDADYVNLNTVGIPTYENLQDWFNITQSSGLICGGGFTNNTDGSITVAAGCGIVKTTDNILGNTIFFDWPENINVTLTNNAINYAYVDYNGGTPVVSSTDDFSTVDFTTQFIIGLIYREDTTLHTLEAGSRRFDFAHRILIQDFEVNGFQRSDGLIINETGTRNFSISEGSFYYISDKHTLAEFDSSGAATFTYFYRDAGTGWTEVADQSQIDNFYYDDDSGTLAEIGNNRYGVAWVYQEFDGDIHVLYGQGSYKLAEANDAQPPLILPTRLSTFAFVVGKVIIYKSATSFTELHSAFDVVFTPSVIIPHNDTTSIQGGTTDEYYHLTSEQHALLTGNLYQSHNLLDNSRFSVNSQSTLEDWESQITLTDVTAGVCLTADTQDIAVGDLFRFDSGDHDTVVGRVTDVATDVSFTLSDTSLTDSGSPGTGYETVPGYIGVDAYAPDGWEKNNTLAVHIIGSTKDGYDKVARLTPGGAGQSLYWPKLAIRTLKEVLAMFAGRSVALGCFGKTTIASHARLVISDGSSTPSDYHTGSGDWEWLEVAKVMSSTPSLVSFYPQVVQSGVSAEFTPPMLIFGDYIGAGNYAPMPSEYIPLDANSVVLIDNTTISANTIIDPYLNSGGKIPTTARAYDAGIKGNCATIGKLLALGRTDSAADILMYSQGISINNAGTDKVRCSVGGLVTLARDSTWLNTSVSITGVYL